MHTFSHVIIAVVCVTSVPALAEPGAPSPGPDAAAKVEAVVVGSGNAEKKADPVICERVQEIGSLLRSKKVCMHKSEWEEQRRGDRANIERSQVQRGLQPAG